MQKITKRKRVSITKKSTPKYKRVIEPQVRYNQFLDCAMEIAKTKGYNKVTQLEVAKKAKTSGGLMHRYFKNIKNLRAQILKKALETEQIDIILQGIATNEIKKIPDKLKAKIVAHLTK